MIRAQDKLGTTTKKGRKRFTKIFIDNGFTNMNLSHEDWCIWIMIMFEDG